MTGAHSSSSSESHKCALCAFNTIEKPGTPDIHLETLLSTNKPPENADLLTTSASLQTAQALHAKLNDLILAIEGSLKRMKNAKSTVESSILQHKGVLHPIRSIPDDILLTIFDWCTLLAIHRRDFISMCPEYAPWTLSRVSSRWRALVLSSPRLWSTVNIHPLSSTAKAAYMKQALSWLVLSLRRSANCDLTIRVAGALIYPEIGRFLEDDTLVQRCLQVLLSTTNRWRTVEFTELSHALLVTFSGSSFERLTDLKVTLPETHNPSIVPICWVTPNLTHLTLKERQLGVMDVSWGRLKYFLCDATSFRHLPKCLALEELAIPQIHPDSIASANFSGPITLPALHTLDMWYSKAHHSIPQLSDLLILPSLNTLRLNSDTFRPSVYPSFHGAIRQIRNLSLSVFYSRSSSVEPLLAFLAECISVTAIYIDAGIANDEVLTALVVLEDPVLLPHLTILGVNQDLLELYPSQVMDVVLSRSGGGSRSVCTLTQLKVMEYPDLEGLREQNWKNETRLTPELREKWSAVNGSVRVSQVDAEVFPFDSVV